MVSLKFQCLLLFPIKQATFRSHSDAFAIGIRSWIAMELVSPLAFSNSYLRSPLSPTSNLALTSPTRLFPNAPPLSLAHPSTLLALLFVTHYVNRALISPLRTPSRSQ